MTQYSLRTAYISNAKQIIFFGIGALLHDCFDLLINMIGAQPDYLCDNDANKWGQQYFGYTCLSPQDMERLCSDDTVVIITIRNFEDIYRQLINIGIKKVFICCYDRRYNVVRALNLPKIPGDLPNLSQPVSVEGLWTLVTGASRGLGQLIALEMAKLGSHIIAHSRSISHLDDTIGMCTECGVQSVPIAADFSDMKGIESLLSSIDCLTPPIDIIFNNAAVSPAWLSGFWSAAGHDYLMTYIINTIAPIKICQHIAPKMIDRGFGRIINVTSSIQNRPGEMAYACSKAALDKFVHDMSPGFKDTGVMISLLDPGWLQTDMGGSKAPHPVQTALPGALIGALTNSDVNGRWISAQDYTNLSIEAAIRKAEFLLRETI